MGTCKTHQYDAWINFLLTEIYRQLTEHHILNHIPRQKCTKFLKWVPRFEACLSHKILQRSPLPWSSFNAFSLGCLLFFTSLFYGIAMNNHKASSGYSISRKKSWMLPWPSETWYQRGCIWTPPDVDPCSVCWEESTNTEDTGIVPFPSIFLISRVLLSLPLFFHSYIEINHTLKFYIHLNSGGGEIFF